MTKVTMPPSVGAVSEGPGEGIARATLTMGGALVVQDGDLLITTDQAETYAAAKVREALEAVAAHVDSEINENSSLVAIATRRNVIRDIQDLFIKP